MREREREPKEVERRTDGEGKEEVEDNEEKGEDDVKDEDEDGPEREEKVAELIEIVPE